MQEAYWLTRAKQLPYLGRTKIECCASDASMIVSAGPKGWSGWCFRCGANPFAPIGTLSIAQIRERAERTQELQRGPVELPKDFTSDIPDAGRVWLLRGGVSSYLTEKYGIGFSPRYGRVILPIRKDGVLDGFVSRSVTDEKPKYLARLRDPFRALFCSDVGTVLQGPTGRLRGTVHCVLTEDVLSAIRVGRVVQAASVLGTSVSDGQLFRLVALAGEAAARAGDDVPCLAIWTDGDKAGRKADLRVRRSLSLQGVRVVSVRTERDPKRYSNREIQDYLDGACRNKE